MIGFSGNGTAWICRRLFSKNSMPATPNACSACDQPYGGLGPMNEPLDVAMDTAGIARITINRPKRANSFDPALASALIEALDWLATDEKVRVLVLMGNGRSFCAGLDLKALPETMAAPYDENYADALKFAKMLHRLHTMPVPTLA